MNNHCAYIGCRRPCSDKFCNAEHALKQDRVVAVLAARNPREELRSAWQQRKNAGLVPNGGRYGARPN